MDLAKMRAELDRLEEEAGTDKIDIKVLVQTPSHVGGMYPIERLSAAKYRDIDFTGYVGWIVI